HLLDGNVEAALAVWAPLGKPALTRVETPSGLRLDPVLLDRSLAFAPGQPLTLPEWHATERSLETLDIFTIAQLDLAAEPGGFSARLRAVERSGFGPTRWSAA